MPYADAFECCDSPCQTRCQTSENLCNEYRDTRTSNCRPQTRCDSGNNCEVTICDERGNVIVGNQEQARVILNRINYPNYYSSPNQDYYRWSGDRQNQNTPNFDYYRWSGDTAPGSTRPGDSYYNPPGYYRPGDPYNQPGNYRPQDTTWNAPGTCRPGDAYCNPGVNYRPDMYPQNWNSYPPPYVDEGRIARLVLPIVLAAINSGNCHNWNSYPSYPNNWHQPRYQPYPGQHYYIPGQQNYYPQQQHYYPQYQNYQPGCHQNYRPYNPGCNNIGGQILQQVIPRAIYGLTNRRHCY